MNHIKNIWKCFEEKHSAIAKWLYQIFYFVIFSMGVTVFQYLVFTFLPGILGIGLAGTEFMWPKVSMNLFGVKFTWSLLGYNVLRDATGNILIGGGLGYFISYELGSFLAQCINFPLQRNITFKSHGNPVYQAIWYFVAWVVISLICNGFNNLWMPVASAYVAPAVYNMLVTIILTIYSIHFLECIKVCMILNQHNLVYLTCMNILKSGNLLAITYARLDYWFLIFFIICLCNYIFLK